MFKNFDILDKNQLSEFKIFKKYSNEETYFYFLDYIISVKIIKKKKDSNKQKEEGKKEKHSKNPVYQFDLSNGCIKIDNIKVNNKIDCVKKKKEKNKKIL